jgi:hypothetical protein
MNEDQRCLIDDAYNAYAGAGEVKVDTTAADAVLARTAKAINDGTNMMLSRRHGRASPTLLLHQGTYRSSNLTSVHII